MIDPNNRPGGDTVVLTAKSANKIQWFDAGTLAHLADLDMPASTHELIRSPDGSKVYASVYGGGIFGKNKDPDRRIAVIDLASKSLERTIDIGANIAPHSVMMDASGTLWSTAELGNAVLAIDPGAGKVDRIDLGGSPHWIAVSHPTGKLFASFKTREAVAVVDTASRRMVGAIPIPHGAEGIAVTPDGETLFVCAHWKGVVHVFDTRAHVLRKTITIGGAPGEANSCAACGFRRMGTTSVPRHMWTTLRRSTSSATLKQIAGFDTPKAPMGFGFAADGEHAYLCCHDAAITLEFELASGRITRQFPTAAGCEFIVSY